MACFHECRNIPDDRVTYPAKSTVYIIFFHRNATSVLLPPSEPEVITFPSRTQTSIFIKILLSIVVCSSFFSSPSSPAPSPSHFTPSLYHYINISESLSDIFVLCVLLYVFCALYTRFYYMFIFFTAYWTLHYIAPCTVFYMYDCAFVTFFIKGYLT